MSRIRIRPEGDDSAAVDEVLRLAFPTSAEADLVRTLRDSVADSVALVAEDTDGHLVGQILFTPVALKGKTESTPLGLGLAPMAVLPDWQRRGVGSALVEAGIAACRDAGAPAVVVLGHTDYYPRFGFKPADDFGLFFGPLGPHPAFMAIELEPDALADSAGEVRYADAFYEG